MEPFEITKIQANIRETVNDFLAEEVPLTLRIDDKELVTLLCSPLDLKDLVRGFLFTSGFIKSKNDVAKIILDKEQWVASVELNSRNINEDLVFKRLYTSGCGRGTLFYNAFDIANRKKLISDFRIEVALIKRLMLDFQKRSKIYLETGGVHSAAIADNHGKIIVFKEDIGRHNAIDKIIGSWINKNFSFEETILLTSGRISSEVLFKIQKCRIPVIVSRSAPTNQAVKLARDLGVTLAGFARAHRMNVYSHQERILWQENVNNKESIFKLLFGFLF